MKHLRFYHTPRSISVCFAVAAFAAAAFLFAAASRLGLGQTAAAAAPSHEKPAANAASARAAAPRWRVAVAALPADASPDDYFVRDVRSSRILESQPYDSDGDGKPDQLLFLSTATPATPTTPTATTATAHTVPSEYAVVRKPADFRAPAPVKRVHARFAPERMDDFLWENDRIAHRVYGPALVTGEGTLSSGIDVFVKSTNALVMDKFYKRGDYHRDHGEGLDCYDVGQSRGLGGTAIFHGGKWYPSGNFVTWRVLAAGPLRVEFELTYAAWDVGGRKVSEVKRFTVDAGSDFTKVVSRFTTTGDAPLLVGAAVLRTDWKGRRKHATRAYALADKADSPAAPAASGDGWLADWQPNRGQNGATAVGLVVPGALAAKAVEGHWILSRSVRSGEPFTYYIGAGWSKGWYPQKAGWIAAVKAFAQETR
ncbi:MAG: DUF4861 domain-containing protein [Puniceicoccales bacterium]|jgi:hypothetical protein|nr:DUF4861 domain-containing protein [Puniceicoccales bacterium]